jgi:hypothetical protein
MAHIVAEIVMASAWTKVGSRLLTRTCEVTLFVSTHQHDYAILHRRPTQYN